MLRKFTISVVVVVSLLMIHLNGFAEADETKSKSKTVSTLLNAKWNSTPLALEISEFLNDEDPTFFWGFIEDVSSQSAHMSGSRFLHIFFFTFLIASYIKLMFFGCFQRLTKSSMKSYWNLQENIYHRLRYLY
jgi:hypothetical protein